MRITQYFQSLAILCLLLGGCNDKDKLSPKAEAERSVEAAPAPAPTRSDSPQPIQAVPPASTAGQPGGSLPDPLRGTVKETMNAGGYTYMLLETKQGSTWAAGRTFAVSVGDEVEVAGMMPMRNFNSPTLKRTFEEIQFVSGARVIGQTAETKPAEATDAAASQSMPAGHPPIGDGAEPTTTTASAAPQAGDVEPLPGGFTVEQLFAKTAELKGKPVRFRGRVVKANRGILGKNWLHIQDGSGSAGTNDIIVTSKAGYAPVGSIVTVEGTLNTDRDFGAGYKYAVIVEDSKLTLETAAGATP